MAIDLKFILKSLFVTSLLSFSVAVANACDLCPLHSATDIHMCVACAVEGHQTDESKTQATSDGKGAFKIGLSEQFTRFDNIQFDGRNVSNPLSQHLDSSITQLFGEYALTERSSVQLSIPFINRSFRRVTDDGDIEKGTESGIGDISLTGTYVPVSFRKKDAFFQWKLLTGVKIPTGETDRLREEADPDHGHEFDVEEDHEHDDSIELHAKRLFRQVSEPGSFNAIHGHDLTLGTGSFDFIFGTSFLALKSDFFLGGAIQYIIRTEGDFDYEFADDLQWHISPGVSLVTNEHFSISLAARLSGEFKDKDRFENAPVDDTRITTLNLGPELDISIGDNWLVSVAFEFPIEQEASSLQIVPSSRAIVNLTYRYKGIA